MNFGAILFSMISRQLSVLKITGHAVMLDVDQQSPVLVNLSRSCVKFYNSEWFSTWRLFFKQDRLELRGPFLLKVADSKFDTSTLAGLNDAEIWTCEYVVYHLVKISKSFFTVERCVRQRTSIVNKLSSISQKIRFPKKIILIISYISY